MKTGHGMDRARLRNLLSDKQGKSQITRIAEYDRNDSNDGPKFRMAKDSLSVSRQHGGSLVC